VFERHDVDRFEVFCFALNPDDRSAFRRKIMESVEENHFREVLFCWLLSPCAMSSNLIFKRCRCFLVSTCCAIVLFVAISSKKSFAPHLDHFLLLAVWEQVDGNTDLEVSIAINNDLVDILIDTDYYKSRLSILATRPAAVQVAPLAYRLIYHEILPEI
jgi:hypothetical protein